MALRKKGNYVATGLVNLSVERKLPTYAEIHVGLHGHLIMPMRRRCGDVLDRFKSCTRLRYNGINISDVSAVGRATVVYETLEV